jgi:8-oxo-dGTP diphosphatase
VAVLLVRHAKAGDREDWDGPDRSRPLTAKGQAQADALVGVLAGFDVVAVLSSPYVRCTQTVAPLAAARGLPVDPYDDLAEGQGRAGVALVRELLIRSDHTVLCTHGDVIEEMLDDLEVSRDEETKKGATWVLDGAVARCLAPPA